MINYQYGFKRENEILGSLEVLTKNYFHYISPIDFGGREANVCSSDFFFYNFLI